MEILAHRGAVEDGVRENTIEAFELAKSKGADGIETDVRMTKDEELVLYHDHSIGKKRVSTLDLKDLESRAGYKIPTLNELLNWADNDFLINLEIKQGDIVPQVYEELKKFKQRNLVISSFHHPTSFKLSKAVDAKCGLLMPLRPLFVKPFMQLIPAKLEYIIWDYEMYDPEFKAELINYKHLVYNMGELRPTKKELLDGIISDHLDIHVKS